MLAKSLAAAYVNTIPYMLPQKCALCPMLPPPFFAKAADSTKNPIPKRYPGIGYGMKKNWMGILGCMVIAENTTADTAPDAPSDL